jgi:hypothetical protein
LNDKVERILKEAIHLPPSAWSVLTGMTGNEWRGLEDFTLLVTVFADHSGRAV